jgi:C-terminal processing protease CtpA/Prc
MKKLLTYTFLLLFSFNAHSQDKVHRQLETIGRTWGTCYMLHPSVVSSSYPLNWEGILVDYLKDYPFERGEAHFLDSLNENMLEWLQDPLTAVQSRDYQQLPAEGIFLLKSYDDYDYMRLPASFLSREKNWLRFDSTLVKRSGDKPLVMDLRFFHKPSLQTHSRDCFSYICGLLTPRTLSLGSMVSRNHLGWDEMNQTTFFDQHWKVSNNGLLPTLAAFPREAQQSHPSVDFSRAIIIDRPVYFLVNNTTLLYYRSRLKALRESSNDISIIWEKRGHLYDQEEALSFSFPGGDLHLNPYVLLSDTPGFQADYETTRPVLQEDLYGIIHTRILQGTQPSFSFNMAPRLYPTAVEPIGREYKLLGLFKLWAVMHYLYDDPGAQNDQVLPRYIKAVLKSPTDRDYYTTLKAMMGEMNHKATYLDDSWIFDFAGYYTVPIKMDWVEEHLVVTATGAEAEEKGVRPGDRIVKIKGRYIGDLLVEANHVFFGEQEHDIRDLAFDRDFFSGPQGSTLEMTIQTAEGARTVLLKRTVRSRHHPNYSGEVSQVDLPSGIGYVTPARGPLTDQLKKHSNARALVVDLREGSIRGDDQLFVQQLTDSLFRGHQTLTPLLSAENPDAVYRQINATTYRPVKESSFGCCKPVAVLIDEHVAGDQERLAWDLKNRNHVFIVGRPTRGRMERLTHLYLPGGARLYFPGQYMLDPKGKRISAPVYPDIKTTTELNDIRAGRDVILETALEEIRKRLR